MKTNLSGHSAIAAIQRWNERYLPVDKAKHWLWVLVRTVLIFGICFIILYPIITKISVAFRDRTDAFDATVIWIPRNFTLDNFKDAMSLMNYFDAVGRTFVLSISTSLLQLISCALAGYGFARLRFKGSNILFLLVIFTIIIPPQTIMAPTYLHYRFFDVFGLYKLFTGNSGINLIETYWPFIISSTFAMGMKNGLYIFIFRQFFRGIPKDLEEAAYVDGAGVLKTFYKVMLPNAVPAITTVVLFSFVWQWNDDYFVSLYFPNTDTLARVLLLLTKSIRGGITTDPSYISILTSAGILLALAPIFILYLFAQRLFVEGVERTGIVG